MWENGSSRLETGAAGDTAAPGKLNLLGDPGESQCEPRNLILEQQEGGWVGVSAPNLPLLAVFVI